MEYENLLYSDSVQLIAGVDEAGRGPLAGPVVCAACIIPKGIIFDGINDSKKLSEKKRDVLFNAIISHPKVMYSIQVVESALIDEINILQATFWGMKKAVECLSVKPDHVLVDGSMLPKWNYSSEALVKGDSRSQLIAAASILAKVTRDRIMLELDQEYPEYGFKKHKGYGTKAHLEALFEIGPCPEHRRSFAPIRDAFKGRSEAKLSSQEC